MGKIISVANQKGGVGKTTAVLNFGLHFARTGKSVLFIDLDPQNNLGDALAPHLEEDDEFIKGAHKGNVVYMFEQIAKPEPYAPEKFSNVYVLGSSKKLAGMTQDNVYDFADSLDLIKDDFDIILIDCPPSVGALQHAALGVSDYLIIMSEANSQSVKGVGKLVTTARQTRRRLNPNLEILGIVPNKVERPITNDMKSNIETLRDEYGELVFDNMLYKTVKVSEAYAKGESLADFSKAHDEKFGFADAAKELETRLEV